MGTSNERLERELVTGDVVAVRPEDDLSRSHEPMLAHTIRQVPVVDASGKPRVIHRRVRYHAWGHG